MTEKPQAIPDSTTEQEQCLGVFNAVHGVVTTPSSYDPALYERFKRIYSEGEPVIITGNMKVFRP